MAANFIPLQPAVPLPIPPSSSGASTKLPIISHAQAAKMCTPLVPADRSVPAVVATASPSSGFHAVSPDPNPAPPQISLVREGDRIAKIRIQCACGQIIELACVY